MGWKDTIQDAPKVEMPKTNWRDTIQDEPEDTTAKAVSTGLIAGANPFSATLGGIGKAAADAITGVRGPLGGGSLSDVLDDYREARDSVKQDTEGAAKEHPYIAGASNIAGGLANPLFQGANTLGKALGAGAIQGLGQGDADLTKGEVGK